MNLKTRDGKNVEIVKHLGNGSLSSRYILKIDGERFFAKIYQNQEGCDGLASRDIIKNEISTYLQMEEWGTPFELFKRFTEIDNVLTLLFEDVSNNYKDLEKIISVNMEPLINEHDNEEKKRKIQAKNYESKTFNMMAMIDVITQVTQKAHHFHTINGDEGIVHMDITPGNIMVYKETIEDKITQKVILADLGLARDTREKDIFKLLNKSKAQGITGVMYYGSEDEPIHNKVYCPPDILEYKKGAKPSIDTYNISNTLCLMLTGKLVEYWKHECRDVKNLEKVLNTKIKERKDSSDITTEQRSKLIEILVKGTQDKADDRYNSSKELLDDIISLNIKPYEEGVIKEIPLPMKIPDVVTNYPVALPRIKSDEKLQQEIERYFKFRKRTDYVHKLETTITNSLQKQKEEEEEKEKEKKKEELLTAEIVRKKKRNNTIKKSIAGIVLAALGTFGITTDCNNLPHKTIAEFNSDEYHITLESLAGNKVGKTADLLLTYLTAGDPEEFSEIKIIEDGKLIKSWNQNDYYGPMVLGLGDGNVSKFLRNKENDGRNYVKVIREEAGTHKYKVEMHREDGTNLTIGPGTIHYSGKLIDLVPEVMLKQSESDPLKIFYNGLDIGDNQGITKVILKQNGISIKEFNPLDNYFSETYEIGPKKNEGIYPYKFELIIEDKAGQTNSKKLDLKINVKSK